MDAGCEFLPQLLMSAEAAKAGFAAIKEYVESTGTRQEKKGTVVIATVKGDIHDIGKNIVKVILETYLGAVFFHLPHEGAFGKLRIRCNRFRKGCTAGSGCGSGAAIRSASGGLKRPDDNYGDNDVPALT